MPKAKKSDEYMLLGYRMGIIAAAEKCENWGDQCAGGSGREIVPSGPSKGQMYGQVFYNLAAAIRAIDPQKGY